MKIIIDLCSCSLVIVLKLNNNLFGSVNNAIVVLTCRWGKQRLCVPSSIKIICLHLYSTLYNKGTWIHSVIIINRYPLPSHVNRTEPRETMLAFAYMLNGVYKQKFLQHQ